MFFESMALHFNPRSLAGATEIDARGGTRYTISIHAPSRERLGCGSENKVIK